MKKILFIEDESALHTALEEVLKKEGFEVLHALDGEAGIRMAKESKPDFILLDLILPKYDGFEVLEKLKEDDSVKDIPVLVLTNREDMQDIQRALDLGARGYLVKANYTLEEVVAKLKDAITREQLS